MKARFIYDIPERQQPATQELADGESWIVERPFWFIRENGEVLFVPPSGLNESATLRDPVWTTDYGSIPRLFQNIFSPVRYGGAYLLHDWLYASENRPRIECDQILLEALKAQGANWLTRQTIYRAVRLGGGVVWSEHRQWKVQDLKEWGQQCRAIFIMPN